MVVDDENFVDCLAHLDFILVIATHCNVSSHRAFQAKFESTVRVGLTRGAASVPTGDILPQILLVQHLHDLATGQLFEPHLVLFFSTDDHFCFFYLICKD